MRKIAFIMLAKGKSNRLPKKNKLLFAGKQMFVWNLVKAMKISKRFYFNSDDEEMIKIARSYGSKIIKRDKNLLDDDVPSRVLFINSIKQMPSDIDGIMSIQANSPNLNPNLIKTCFDVMAKNNFDELLTFNEELNIYGSIWGISRRRLLNSSSSVKVSDKITQKPDFKKRVL